MEGLTGTRWDPDVGVIAGVAPEATVAVRLNGEAAAVTSDAGELPVFAGEVAVTGSPVTVQALDADGDVLDEREVTPADFARAGDRAQVAGGPPALQAGWPFEHITEAVVQLWRAEDAEELAEELADLDGIARAEVAVDGSHSLTGPPPEDASDRSGLGVLVLTAITVTRPCRSERWPSGTKSWKCTCRAAPDWRAARSRAAATTPPPCSTRPAATTWCWWMPIRTPTSRGSRP